MSKLARKLFANADIHFTSDFGNVSDSRQVAFRSIHMKDPENGQAGGSGGETGADDEGGSEEEAGADDEDGKSGADDESADKKPSSKAKAVSDAEAKLLKEVMTLKQKLRGKDDEVKTLKATVGDLTPDEVREAIEAKKASEIKELESKKEYTRIVERMRVEHQKDLSAKEAQLKEILETNKNLQTRVEELTIGRQFGESVFIQKNSALPPSIARKEFGAHFETLEDGTVVGYDKPVSAADKTMIVDSNGDPKKFDDVIAELFAKHPDAENIIRSSVRPGVTGNEPKVVISESNKGAKGPRGLAKIQAGLSQSKS